MVFLDFGVWAKDFKVFDLRFAFLVKNCVYVQTLRAIGLNLG